MTATAGRTTTEAAESLEVLTPHSAAYDSARKVWNAAVDAQPALIARPRDAAGVAAAVRLGRERGLEIAVRGGGHGIAGQGTVAGGLVIYLSAMRSLSLDPASRMVRLEPGLTWGEVAEALHPHGLAITSGDTASVGVGGLVQGGGIGWMVRKHGLTIDRLRAVEIVTADGVVRRASASENPDLFWAVRGGGAGVGIITALEIEAHDGGTVYGGAVFYDARDARAILSAYLGIAATAPDELSTQAILIAAPAAPFVPAAMVGKPLVGILACYSGEPDEGERAVAPLRQLGAVVADLMGPMPYPAMFHLSEAGQARGLRHAVRSAFLRSLDDPAVDGIVSAFEEVVNPGTLVQLRVLGGAMARVPREATAFAHRDAGYLILIENGSPDSAGSAAWLAAQAASERIWTAARVGDIGAYANFLGLGEEARAADAYPAVARERLRALKVRYDPQGIFNRNDASRAVLSNRIASD